MIDVAKTIVPYDSNPIFLMEYGSTIRGTNTLIAFKNASEVKFRANFRCVSDNPLLCIQSRNHLPMIHIIKLKNKPICSGEIVYFASYESETNRSEIFLCTLIRESTTCQKQTQCIPHQ